jgi:dynein heavy chain
MQILDDNTMSLQGMSASRFIGPFLNTVQTWEKSLSLISEVIEVWKQFKNYFKNFERVYNHLFLRFGLLFNENGCI